MPNIRASSRKKKEQHFPGDPRFGILLSVLDEDVKALREREWLSTRLLDFLIQQAAPAPQVSNGFLLGSLGVETYLHHTNALLENENDHSRQIQRVRAALESFCDNNSRKLIIPVIEGHHFYVLVVEFSGSCPLFYEKVRCYDSLRHSGRSRVQPGSHLQQLLSALNRYIMSFILHKDEARHRPASQLCSMLQFVTCPQQTNGIDCGLFAVGTILHLLSNKEVNGDIFNPEHVSHLRKLLATYFSSQASSKKARSVTIPSELIRNCFPLLKGTTIVDECGVEIVGTGEATKPCDAIAIAEQEQVSDKDSSTETQYEEDTLMEQVLKDRKVQVFASLDDVVPMVERYEHITGNRLIVRRSESNRYRLYKCSEHVNCSYEVLFGRRRSDGYFALKRVNNKHRGVRRSSRAKDGRRWKERRAGKLASVIVHVTQTKKDPPVPADVMKTSVTLNGDAIPYSAAYRALHSESRAARKEELKDFELIIPYLDRLKANNPGSVIGYTRDADLTLRDLHVFPEFVNESLNFVRPVISLDAAHLKGKYKGTLFIATVLTANNEVYPLGFLISSGNEDLATWTKMLTLLKEACPLIASTDAWHTEERESYFHSDHHSEFLRFVFISDRDKGLKAALKAIFPRNLETSCAKHDIDANVAQRYGQKCARFVCPIAKTFSTRRENYLLEQIRIIKPDAVSYLLEDLKDVVWRGTSWLDERKPLPARYGIVTSNTSESVNSMFMDARNVGWLRAVDTIIDIMSTRISKLRSKYEGKGDNDIVPRVAQVVKKRWDESAGFDIVELEVESDQFKVVNTAQHTDTQADTEDAMDEDDTNHSIPNIPLVNGQRSTHILKPDKGWCTCGVWQEFHYPCHHACAYFRKWLEKDLTHVFQSEVDEVYSYHALKELFKRNIVPVVLDSVAYDGQTKPPVVTQRMSGRPKVKRIRRRSELLNAENSPVSCSICGQRGHNRRTCKKEKEMLSL